MVARSHWSLKLVSSSQRWLRYPQNRISLLPGMGTKWNLASGANTSALHTALVWSGSCHCGQDIWWKCHCCHLWILRHLSVQELVNSENKMLLFLWLGIEKVRNSLTLVRHLSIAWKIQFRIIQVFVLMVVSNSSYRLAIIYIFLPQWMKSIEISSRQS